MSWRFLAARLRGLRLRIWFWPAVAAVGLFSASCGGAPASSPATVKLTHAEIAVLTDSVSPVINAEVDNAYQVLVDRCMQAKGLAYFPTFLTAADLSRPQQVPGVPGAAIGMAAREADGYGFYSQAVQAAASPSGGQSAGQEETYADSLTGPVGRRYRLTLDGPYSQRISVNLPGGGSVSIQTGGCLGAAARRLYGSVGNYVQATTGSSLLYDELYGAVVSDPRFSAVVARWSSCMTSHGFKYRTPDDLWNGLGTRIHQRPTPAARDLEIKVAVADYRCAATVKLVPTARRLQNEHAQYLSRSLAQALALVTKVDANAAKLAKSLNPPS